MLLAVCITPVIASYLAYYVFPPSGRVNYGTLIQPQIELPSFVLQEQDGTPFEMKKLQGQWVMLVIGPSSCHQDCRERLWQVRQLRLAAGKDSDRIERVMWVTDKEPIEIMLMREHEGLRFLRADKAQVERLLQQAVKDSVEQHVWLVDPLGNLMMYWPSQADPNRMKKDLIRLLKASRIG